MKLSALHVLKWSAILLSIGVFYLVTSVPVGLFLYSMKSDMGINVFEKTGFHSYVQCLREEAYKIQIQNKSKENDNK